MNPLIKHFFPNLYKCLFGFAFIFVISLNSGIPFLFSITSSFVCFLSFLTASVFYDIWSLRKYLKRN